MPPLVGPSHNLVAPLPLRAAMARCAIVIAAGLGSLGCFSAYSAPEAGHWTEQKTVAFPSRTPGLLEVHLREGHVLVQHGDALVCDVEVRVRAADEATARAQARAVEPVLDFAPHRAQLRLSHPPGAPLDAVDARYHLRVPPEVGLRVLTRSAQVAIRGYRGAVEVRTDSGEILARPDGGSCQLVTESAPIRLEGSFDAATITTESGSIEVVLPAARSPVEIEAHSDSGPVVLDMAETSRMQLSYTTHTGNLRTDFPVEWSVDGVAQEGRKRFEGVLGQAEDGDIVTATVVSRFGRFEVRRLPNSAAPLQR